MEISILILTYNHKKYIKQALDSIIKQKIKVPYEILVLDDASTDGTQEILREYKRKYPQLLSLYLRKKNVYHPTKNSYFLASKAKGRYIAILEGDDYWIDSLKLQKQYDFLEEHKDFSACITDLKIVDENDLEISDFQVFEKKKNHIYDIQDFKRLSMPGMSVTLMARNYFEKDKYSILMEASKNMADITRFMLLILQGNIYQLDDKTAAYRYVSVTGENNFNSINKDNKYREYNILLYWIKLENFMKRYYDKKFELLPIVNNMIMYSAKYEIKPMIKLILESDNRIRYLLTYIINKFFLESKFVSNKNVKVHSKENWKKFEKEKCPLVLFGAGTVAEEYLDKYAWKGNILFIVDNDKRKQNISYKGFLVKEPSELFKYKSQVSVLITNKNNEKEIEEQLCSMGIERYYCYCAMQSCRFKNLISLKILNILSMVKNWI